jgi:hypothetical protein
MEFPKGSQTWLIGFRKLSLRLADDYDKFADRVDYPQQRWQDCSAQFAQSSSTPITPP